MPEVAEPIIIIKRKKGGHAGHHGGAWKVAYADFVTAMMSLFIVLWLISSNDAVKNSVAAYFQDPKGTARLAGSSNKGVGHTLPLRKEDMKTLKQRLEEAVRQLPHFDKLGKQIEITAMPDGLQIELLEEPGGTFFELGSATPTPALAELLTVVSRELGRVANKISIEGHTDALPYSEGANYTNWELSADRANAARRLMRSSGIGPNQIAQVRGFADQKLRLPDHPTDPSNRRITLIVAADPSPEQNTLATSEPRVASVSTAGKQSPAIKRQNTE